MNTELLKCSQNHDKLKKVHVEITLLKCIIFQKVRSNFCLSKNEYLSLTYIPSYNINCPFHQEHSPRINSKVIFWIKKKIPPINNK